MSTTAELLDQIRAGPKGPEIAAVFDLDGTLIDGYSAAALYSHRLRNFEITGREVVRTIGAALGGPMTEDQFRALLEEGIRGWAGRTESDLHQLGERLFQHGTAGSLFHDAWRLVKAHQRRGHTVVIASSATRFQVGPIARALDVEHVLCTELETEGGLLTGRVHGRTLWGPGKAAAVHDFARRHGIDLQASHAYANGDEDIPLLAAVGRPHPTNPQDELARAAAERAWPVLWLASSQPWWNPGPAIRTAGMYAGLLGSAGAGLLKGTIDGDRRGAVDLATSLFGDVGAAFGDISVEVTGQQHVWSHRPAVFFINHQSALVDLVVTTRLLRTGFTAVAKEEIRQMPVFGRLFAMAGVAFVNRADGSDPATALQPAVETLRAGTSVVMAPEGTRSVTPQVGAFKKGGFHLAAQAGVPIVPIVIRNAGEIMWRDALTARPGTIQVLVHPPIPTEGWTADDLDAQVDRVRRLYVDTLEDWPPAAQASASRPAASPPAAARPAED